MIGINIGNTIGRRRGVSWSSYWATLKATSAAFFDYKETISLTDIGGGQISTWIDKFVNGPELAQAGATKYPLLTADGVLFDGSNDILVSGAFVYEQPFYIYLVMRLKAFVSTKQFFDGGTYASAYVYQDTGLGEIRFTAGAFPGSILIPIDKFVIVRIYANGASGKLGVNGAWIAGDCGTNDMNGFALGAGNFKVGWDYSNIEVKGALLRGDDVANERTIYNKLDDYYGIGDRDDPFDNGKLVITFDDGMETQFSAAYPILVSEGVKATFYLISGAVGTATYMTWANALTMHNAGMDMECHSQAGTNLGILTEAQIITSLGNLNDAFTANGLPEPEHIAYPLGGVNCKVKRAIAGLRKSGRTIFAGNIRKNTERLAMPSSLIDNIDDAGLVTLKGLMDTAQANKEGMTLFSHSVTAGGAVGSISSAHFTEVIQYAKSIGMDIITIKELYALMNPVV